MSNNLKITVSGKISSGKSTMIEMIDRMLKEHGFITEVNHLDISAKERKEWVKDLDNRIESLKQKKKTSTMILVEQSTGLKD